MAIAPSRFDQTLGDDLARVEEELALVGHDAGPVLYEAIRHHLHTGGKRIRPRLALMAGHLICGYIPDGLVRFAAVTELVHAASLVHDDTLDEAATRRGITTVSAQWGNQVAVLVGDYLFAQAALLTAGLESVRLMAILATTIQALVQGELRQMSAAYRVQASAENYESRIGAKSASLFVLAAEGGATCVGASAEQALALQRYAYAMGLAFQIADDVLDYTATDQELGKPAGSDLANGVITLPALYYLQSLVSDAAERHIIEEGGDVGRLVQAIRASDAPARALDYARELVDRAVAELSTFPDTVERAALAALARSAISRR
ncbi:MAG TPA: polyprenyl synthetase family protein, partial [Chloroflexota bacterium]|nr:polyprenyl synthetase family protein [Chloroflexota bacterium]